MLKSSLLEILRIFTKQELIKFEDFVRSLYFNAAGLFPEIKKHTPDLTSDNSGKEKVLG